MHGTEHERRPVADAWVRPRALASLVLAALASGAAPIPAASGGATAAEATERVWPLDAKPVLTSSFGEFRDTHLHAGIDLATGGRIGRRCFAVGDGYVARLRMSPYGYGKAVYIQLDSGPLVVYAHLSRFAPAMARRARAEQARRRRYTFDVHLERDAIRVRRGEVVGWSGDTGVGFPHLHFEMRDGDVARNPQTAGFELPDRVPPEIRDVSVLPLEAAAHVDGSPGTRVLPKSRLGAAGEPLRVGGRVGFGVRCIDRAAPGPYRQAPYRYTLRIDGRTHYEATLERFDYAHNHHIVLEYDQERLLADGARSFLLFARPGNALEGRRGRGRIPGTIVAGGPPAGENLAPGRHEVEIEVADVAGNRDQVRFAIWAGTRPQIRGPWAQRVDGGWEVSAIAEDADGDSLRVVFEASGDSGMSWEPVADLTPHEGRWTGRVSGKRAGLWLRCTAEDPVGLQARGTAAFVDAAAVPAAATHATLPTLRVTPHWHAERLRVRVEASAWLAAAPHLAVRGPDGRERRLGGARQVADTAWEWLRDVADLGSTVGVLVVEGRTPGGEPVRVEVPAGVAVVRRGEARVLEEPEGRWALELGPETLFAAAPLRGRAFDVQRLVLGPELAPAGPCFEVLPRTAAVDRSFLVRARPGSPGAGDGGRGLFYVDRRGNLKFLSADRDAAGNLVGKAPYLTVFAVLRDSRSPRLERFRLAGGRRTPRLEFRVADDGAGIADGDIDTRVDGAWALPEWDPETGRVQVQALQPWGPGEHELVVRVRDRVGNTARRQWSFTLP